MSFRIVTDTSANLPTELLRRNNITAIPFSYYMDDIEYTCEDTELFDGMGYYQKIRDGKWVKTSQITPGRYTEFLEPILAGGEDILIVGMSSGISGSFNCACIAAEQLRDKYPQRRIRLVDTLGASLGEGIQVLNAVECKNSGMTLDDTADYLDKRRHNMCQVFTVDDLMHLRRSGRVSNVTAIVGTALGV